MEEKKLHEQIHDVLTAAKKMLGESVPGDKRSLALTKIVASLEDAHKVADKARAALYPPVEASAATA